MATFYIGKRPVLKGRNGEVVNTYTKKNGVYSNWDLMNTSHVLDGAPDRNVAPGGGLYPHGIQLSRTFTGQSDQTAANSLKNPGMGTRLDPYYFRQKPDLWKGVPSGNAFPGNWGHLLGQGKEAEYAVWTNFFFAGVPSAQVLKEPGVGHKIQAYGTHYAFFGPTKPYEFRGVVTRKSEPLLSANVGHPEWRPSLVADKMPSDYGQIPAARATVEHYGFEHPLEWFGVPSAKAL
jgi:hypothetical protein